MAGDAIEEHYNDNDARLSKRQKVDGYSNMNLNLPGVKVEHFPGCYESNNETGAQPPGPGQFGHTSGEDLSCSITIRRGNRLVHTTTTSFAAVPGSEKVEPRASSSQTMDATSANAFSFMIDYTAKHRHQSEEVSSVDITDGIKPAGQVPRSEGITMELQPSKTAVKEPDEKVGKVRGKGIKRSTGSKIDPKRNISYWIGNPFTRPPCRDVTPQQFISCLNSLEMRPGMLFSTHEEAKFIALIYCLAVAKRPSIVKYDNKRKGMLRLACSHCSFTLQSTNLSLYGEYQEESEGYRKPIYPNLIYVTEFVPHSCPPQEPLDEPGQLSSKWYYYLAFFFDFFGHPSQPPSANEKEIVFTAIEEMHAVENQPLIRSESDTMSSVSLLVGAYKRGGVDLCSPTDLISRLHVPALLLQTTSPESLIRLCYTNTDGERVYAPPISISHRSQTKHYHDRIEQWIQNVSSLSIPDTANMADKLADGLNFVKEQISLFQGCLPWENNDDMNESSRSRMVTMLNQRQSGSDASQSHLSPFDSENLAAETRLEFGLFRTLYTSSVAERLEAIRNTTSKFRIVPNCRSRLPFGTLKPLAVKIKSQDYDPSMCTVEQCANAGDSSACKRHIDLQTHHQTHTEYVRKRMNMNPHVLADAFEQVFPNLGQLDKSSFKGITVITGEMRHMAQYALPLVSISCSHSLKDNFGIYVVMAAVGYTVENELTVFGVSITDSASVENWLEFTRDLKLAYREIFIERKFAFISDYSSPLAYALQIVFPELSHFKSLQTWKDAFIWRTSLSDWVRVRVLLIEMLSCSNSAVYVNFMDQLRLKLRDDSALNDDPESLPFTWLPKFGHFSTEAGDAFHRLFEKARQEVTLRLPFYIHNLQVAIAKRTMLLLRQPGIKFIGDTHAFTPRASEMLALCCLFSSQYTSKRLGSDDANDTGLYEVKLIRGKTFDVYRTHMNQIPLLYEAVNIERLRNGDNASLDKKYLLQLRMQATKYIVDLRARTCTCSYFQMNLLPCIHAMCVLVGSEDGEREPASMNVSKYCSPVYYSKLDEGAPPSPEGTTAATGAQSNNPHISEALDPSLGQLLYLTEFFRDLHLRRTSASFTKRKKTDDSSQEASDDRLSSIRKETERILAQLDQLL